MRPEERSGSRRAGFYGCGRDSEQGVGVESCLSCVQRSVLDVSVHFGERGRRGPELEEV